MNVNVFWHSFYMSLKLTSAKDNGNPMSANRMIDSHNT